MYYIIVIIWGYLRVPLCRRRFDAGATDRLIGRAKIAVVRSDRLDATSPISAAQLAGASVVNGGTTGRPGGIER